MEFTISSNEIYFIVIVLFSVLGAIALIYLILILRRLLQTLSKVNKNMDSIMKDATKAVSNTNEILNVVKNNQQELDTTIKSIAKISNDATNVTNNISEAVCDVKSVFDSTKNFASNINKMTQLVNNSMTVMSKQKQQKPRVKEVSEKISTSNGEIELKGVKVEVNHE